MEKAQQIANALQMPISENEISTLKRICAENEYKQTTRGAMTLLEDSKDFIGHEAYSYWSMVALQLPN